MPFGLKGWLWYLPSFPLKVHPAYNWLSLALVSSYWISWKNDLGTKWHWAAYYFLNGVCMHKYATLQAEKMCSNCRSRCFSLVKQVERLITNISRFKACLPLRQQAQRSHIHFPLVPGLFLLRVTLCSSMSQMHLRYIFFCHMAGLFFFFFFPGSILHKSPEKAVFVGQKGSHHSKGRAFWKLLRSFFLHTTTRSAVHRTTTDLCSSHHTHRASRVFWTLKMERSPMLNPCSFIKCGGCPGAMT